jgi:hypothetical protein
LWLAVGSFILLTAGGLFKSSTLTANKTRKKIKKEKIDVIPATAI